MAQRDQQERMALLVQPAPRVLKERLEQLAQQAQLVSVAQLGRKDRKVTKAQQVLLGQLVPLVQRQRLPVQLDQQARLVLPVLHHLLQARLVRPGPQARLARLLLLQVLPVQLVLRGQLVLLGVQPVVALTQFSGITAKL